MHHPHYHSLVLHRLPHIGAATYNRLVELFGSPESALTQSISKLETLVNAETALAIRDFQSKLENSIAGQRALVDLEWLTTHSNAHLIAISDSAYQIYCVKFQKRRPYFLCVVIFIY